MQYIKFKVNYQLDWCHNVKPLSMCKNREGHWLKLLVIILHKLAAGVQGIEFCVMTLMQG